VVADRDAPTLELLDRFRLAWRGAEHPVPPQSATVVAYLAIANRPLHRSMLAGVLWSKVPEERALGALRSALYRIRAPVVTTNNELLQLNPRVTIDFRDAMETARRLLSHSALPARVDTVTELLTRELLPNCDELWLEAERERYRHLRLRALDALASRLTDAQREAEAVEVAQAAVALEPMSETAEAALVRALVAEGNEALAVRQYQAFRRRLWSELHVRPRRSFEQLAAGATSASWYRD
jgi:DNA-binding SARP family transcriptional activator